MEKFKFSFGIFRIESENPSLITIIILVILVLFIIILAFKWNPIVFFTKGLEIIYQKLK